MDYEVGETIQILIGFQQPLIHGKIISIYQKDTRETWRKHYISCNKSRAHKVIRWLFNESKSNAKKKSLKTRKCERWKEKEFDEGSWRKQLRKQEKKNFDENSWWKSFNMKYRNVTTLTLGSWLSVECKSP